jgi:transcriptional regulator with XRE-family HTH domain
MSRRAGSAGAAAGCLTNPALWRRRVPAAAPCLDAGPGDLLLPAGRAGSTWLMGQAASTPTRPTQNDATMSPSATTLGATFRRHSGRHSDVASATVVKVTTPNNALRAARMGLLMSQDEFARALQRAGAGGASKRQVQRLESGETLAPRPATARALEVVTGLPIETLGFAAPANLRVSNDGHGGHDVDNAPGGIQPPAPGPTGQAVGRGNLSGVWLSRYEYYSSGREAMFTNQHHVVVLQHGDRLTVRSLPGTSTSQLTLDLTVDGNVITGTWVEQTGKESYYRGARYHGAIQLLAEPTGRRLSGKWVGFGRDMDVNTGPWEFVFLDASTSKASLDRYNRPPD